MIVRVLIPLLCAWLLTVTAHAAGEGVGLGPQDLGVVINDADPHSVEVGAYYVRVRGIPAQNIVHVSIPGKPQRLDPGAFDSLRDRINRELPPGVQAVLMIWTAPWAVDCNSITSAFTLGFDRLQCLRSCAAGKSSPYFNVASPRPYRDLGLRLSMLLPTESVEQAKSVIDRGLASGFAVPRASAYYLVTTDAARAVRVPLYPPAGPVAVRKLTVRHTRADYLENVRDIMLYQTGSARVPKLETLSFLPGALADHLTSWGGDLLGKHQMSSLRWLEAGATASYGTVSEPCNHWQKFPHPTVLLRHYLDGATAIEAYWRSVAWPAQGLFIGEPLAAPYRRKR
jgi:uncharacterized protein (TIGR03790 family)